MEFINNNTFEIGTFITGIILTIFSKKLAKSYEKMYAKDGSTKEKRTTYIVNFIRIIVWAIFMIIISLIAVFKKIWELLYK